MGEYQKPPPFSEVVRLHGEDQAEKALAAADGWRSWAEELDVLIRETPYLLGPWVYAEDGERVRVAMGAEHVDRAAIVRRLYRVLADADAVAGALTRAAGLACEMSEELSVALALDEVEDAGGESGG